MDKVDAVAETIGGYTPVLADSKLPILNCIEAIDRVLNIHENHLTKADDYILLAAKEHLLAMSRQGFR